MSQLMTSLFSRLAKLRYELRDAGRARRHRYQIYDREEEKVLAKFDELLFAENSLQQFRDSYIRELENEHSRVNLSVA